MRSIVLSGVLLASLAVPRTGALADTFTTVDLSPYGNATLSATDSGYPTGNQTFLGVPVFINPVGNNTWYANNAANGTAGTVSVDVKTSVFGAKDVYTLINTDWGQFGPNSYASIEFKGTGGADLVVNLIGGTNIRDYNNDGWTNTINGTTTQQVVSLEGGQHRLDMQTFALPSAFLNQTLTDVILTDSGNANFQRTFLAGVTIQAAAAGVPEPGPLALLGLAGAAGVVTARVRRRKSA